MKKQLGFNIVEVMVLVTIIGILAAIAIPVYQDHESLVICGDDKGRVGSDPSDERCAKWYQKLEYRQQRQPTKQPLVIKIGKDNKPVCISGYTFVNEKQLIGANGGGVSCTE